MKQPRLDMRDVLSKPQTKALFNFLLRREEPIRFPDAREQLGLSIGQFGMALRSLEYFGLAQRRNLKPEGEDATGRLPLMYVEATDAGREHGTRLASFLQAASASAPSPSQA